ncbi:MAG: hypothetical protein ACR650_12680, partial [Methylocystis sp.]
LSLRDNQSKAHKNLLVLLSLRDNHPNTATGTSHPDCRALLTQIVAPYRIIDRSNFAWAQCLD